MSPNNKSLPEIPLEELPSWLNNELFHDCLKRDYPECENLKTQIISVRPAVPPGENYTSIIYRVQVEVNNGRESKIQNLIIKQITKEAKENMKGSDLFKKEAIVYLDLLPQFSKYYNEIGENVEFGPKIYKYLEEPNIVYILEDLNERNYFVMNRKVGLDLDRSIVFYKKLAKFHAASVVHREKHGDYDQEYFTSTLSTKTGETVREMFDGMFKYFVEAIENNENLCHLTDKIVSIRNNKFTPQNQ